MRFIYNNLFRSNFFFLIVEAHLHSSAANDCCFTWTDNYNSDIVGGDSCGSGGEILTVAGLSKFIVLVLLLPSEVSVVAKTDNCN